jgi:hypothetical protein
MMTELRALLITDRVIDSQRSPGFRWRIRLLQSWLQEAGFDVVHQPVTAAPLPSVARRFVATMSSVRSLRRQADEFDLVVVHAMNAPHMVWLAQRLGQHGAVILDVCDSLAIWAQAVPWRVQPFFRFKIWLAGLLLRSGSNRMTCSYITFRDAKADTLARPSQSSIVIPSTNPNGLGHLEKYVGPPVRLVIAADLGGLQNVEALSWFEDAVKSGGLQLRIPVEIYGPVEPDHQLPEGIVYMGWAPQLHDIYEGQTAVFAPTVRGAGIQGKYLEAVAAGRPVVVGRQPAEAIPAYIGALPFASRSELVTQLNALQSFAKPLDPGATAVAPESELERGLAVVRVLASSRRGRFLP